LGVFADRGTTISGMAVLLAVRELRGKILATASEMLATNEVELTDGIVAGKQGKRLTLGEIAKYSLWRRNGKPLSSEVAYDPDTIRLDSKVSFIGNPSTGYTFCAQAAQVEVDMGTGQVKVLRIASAHDSGRIINPLLAEGQVQGAIIQGLGFALSERLILEDGEVKNPNLRDYKIPTFLDLPEIKVHFVESCEETGPFGAKGIGQTGIITTAPTIANAVSDAIGARITQLPMTPETVWRAISLNETSGGNYGAK
jgi:xanthine dehydrogenase molybdenum-binding subunit